MSTLNILFIFINLTLFPISIFANTALNFNTPNHFKVNFKQIKYLKHTDIKLSAEGTLELDKISKIILWTQEKPFKNEISIRLEDLNDNSNMGNKVLKAIGKIFFDIFNGSTTDLEQNFKINKINKTKVSLIPKDEKISQFLNEITIIGNDNIENFYIQEKNGNYLHLTFESFTVLDK